MEKSPLLLTMARPGKKVTIVRIAGGAGRRARLTAMGLREGMTVRILHSHHPGPILVAADNTRLAIGRGMAQAIMVRED